MGRVENKKYAPGVQTEKKLEPFERVARAHAMSRGSIQTRRLYTQDIDEWLAYCREHGIKPERPTLEAATEFRNLKASRLKPQTVRRTLAALSRMYRAAVNSKPQGANWNPFDTDALTRPPASSFSKTQALTDEQVKSLFETIAAGKDLQARLRDTALIRILYDTGLRVSSVVTMERSKLYKRDGVLVARVIAKKKDEVEVELSSAAALALETWFQHAPLSKYVFPAARGPGPLTKATVNKHLEMYGQIAGVPHVHPHRFRASYISSALDAGLPLYEIQAAVHHSDPSVTLRYDTRIRGKGVSASIAAFREKKDK